MCKTRREKHKKKITKKKKKKKEPLEKPFCIRCSLSSLKKKKKNTYLSVYWPFLRLRNGAFLKRKEEKKEKESEKKKAGKIKEQEANPCWTFAHLRDEQTDKDRFDEKELSLRSS
ncbi:Hypothetical predicted protein [Octopus vulgaris]|uniref:Uncharacterized protein n=1 Tax=Octopus vulgaris TaxID=6645 RepID=A0AA36C2K5_OCTVU|nr:Hypothetical predicted protein [Octopus vulgaris]